MKNVVLVCIVVLLCLGSHAQYQQFKASIYAVTSSGASLADGNTVVFDNSFSNSVDNDDVIKVSNFGENLGILRDGQTLQIEARSLVVSSDTIYYKVWNLKQQQYYIQFVPKYMGSANLTATLHDNYLATTSGISLTDTTRIYFTVNSTPGSYSSDRFKVVLKVSSIVPLKFLSISASQVDQQVSVGWRLACEGEGSTCQVERSIDGKEFKTVDVLSALAHEHSYVWNDLRPLYGDNYYRIKGTDKDGWVGYSSIVKVRRQSSASSINVRQEAGSRYLLIQLVNQPAGDYAVSVFTADGVQQGTFSIHHTGGTTISRLQVPAITPASSLIVRVSSSEIKTYSTQILIR